MGLLYWIRYVAEVGPFLPQLGNVPVFGGQISVGDGAGRTPAAREMTQVHLAKILGVNQAAVSKMERRADMYVTTLQDFVKAMGGELKIIAKFPEGTVEISQFEDVKKVAAGAGKE